MISPTDLILFNEYSNPLTVSSINEKSLVGYNEPRCIFFLFESNCVMIVGIIALFDCLGP